MSLTHLDVSSNDIDSSALMAIQQCATANTVLAVLDLRSNPLPLADLLQLDRFLRDIGSHMSIRSDRNRHHDERSDYICYFISPS